MPQYLLSVCFDEPYDDVDLNTPDVQRIMARTDELTAEMERTGAWVFVACGRRRRRPWCEPRAATSR